MKPESSLYFEREIHSDSGTSIRNLPYAVGIKSDAELAEVISAKITRCIAENKLQDGDELQLRFDLPIVTSTKEQQTTQIAVHVQKNAGVMEVGISLYRDQNTILDETVAIEAFTAHSIQDVIIQQQIATRVNKLILNVAPYLAIRAEMRTLLHENLEDTAEFTPVIREEKN